MGSESRIDVLQRVITEYKAKTEKHITPLKALKKELKAQEKAHKDLAKEAEDSAKKQNSATESIGTKWTELRSQLSLLKGGFDVLRESLNAFAEDEHLRAVSQGADLAALDRAAQGLLNKEQLLRIAAAQRTSQFGASQRDAEALAFTIAKLGNNIGDLGKAYKIGLKGFIEGGVEEFQQLGMSIRDVNGVLVTKGEKGAIALFGELNEQFEEGGELGSDTARAVVDMDDAMRDLKLSLGEVAKELKPVVDLIAYIAGGLAQIPAAAKAAGEALGDLVRSDSPFATVLRSLGGGGAAGLSALEDAEEKRRRGQIIGGRAGRAIPGLQERADERYAESQARLAKIAQLTADHKAKYAEAEQKGYEISVKRQRAAAKAAQEEARWLAQLAKQERSAAWQGLWGAIGDAPSQLAGMVPKAPQRMLGAEGFAGLGLAVEGGETVTSQVEGMSHLVDSLEQQMSQLAAEEEETFLARLFGPLEDFDSYQVAFDTLTAGMDAAFIAWRDGGASLGEALREGLKVGAKVLSDELWLQGKKHVAYAAGEVAQHNYGKAALHAGAAALFFGGAGLAGSVGRGGSPQGGGASVGTSPGSFGSRATSKSERPLVMIYAGDYADDRAALAERTQAMLDYADKNHPPTNTITDE